MTKACVPVWFWCGALLWLSALGAHAAPKAPTNLAATAVATNQVNLSWTDNATNEDGFKIERAPDAGGVPRAGVQIATPTDGITSFGWFINQ